MWVRKMPVIADYLIGKSRTTSAQHGCWDDSVLDPGAPQYTVPEYVLVDILQQRFTVDGQPSLARQLRGSLDHRVSLAEHLGGRIGEGGSFGSVRLGPGVSRRDLADFLCSVIAAPKGRKVATTPVHPVDASLVGFYSLRRNAPNYNEVIFLPAVWCGAEGAGAELLQAFDEVIWPATLREDADLLQILARNACGAAGFPPAGETIRPRGEYEDPPKGLLLREPGRASSNPATRFAKDLRALISFCAKLPRLTWVSWLSSLLRIELPLYLLWRMKAATRVAEECERVLAGTARLSGEQVTRALLGGGEFERPVLVFQREPTSQIDRQVKEFARARLTIVMLVELLEACGHFRLAPFGHKDTISSSDELRSFLETPRDPDPAANSFYRGGRTRWRLDLPGGPEYPVDTFLADVAAARASLDSLARELEPGSRVVDLLRRARDRFFWPSWANNIWEYLTYNLAVAERRVGDEEVPDELFLGRTARRQRGGVTRAVSIDPGAGLLELWVQLVHWSMKSLDRAPMLEDLLDYLWEMRIEVPVLGSDDGRAMLVKRLERKGLAVGSPDAGEALPLNPPYPHL